MTPPHASGQGSGKLILFGEHAVVWGASALATSLPAGAVATIARTDALDTHLTLERGGEQLARISPDAHAGPLEQALAVLLSHFTLTSTLDIHVTLNVPPGAGLGSSAALATAIARALCKLDAVTDASHRVTQAVQASEGIFHSSASGIDQAAADGSGLIHFKKGPPIERTILRDIPDISIAICQAAPGASTAMMVQGVAARRACAQERYATIAQMITQIVNEAIVAMRAQDLPRLGELMDFNHGLLCAMGVSTQDLDMACHVARHAGALGAKLTGAGGGGCIYALGDSPAHASAIAEALTQHGFEAFSTTISGAPSF